MLKGSSMEETLESPNVHSGETLEFTTSTTDAAAIGTTTNNDNSSENQSDTSSDSDSDGDDDVSQKLQLQTLESELANNPNNYDAHVQYIKILRKMGDIEKLRQAREAMSEVFPLTPQMWQDWARDEASLITGPEKIPVIEKLYERGVFDYLSVPLWCDYANFVQDHDPSVRECSSDGISKVRDLFERALTATGLHVSEGSKIWEAYRDFELAILQTLEDIEEKEKQVQRIRSIFHRQLSIPHLDLSSTLLSYKAWEAEQGNALDVNCDDMNGISRHVVLAYKKALEMLDARTTFEEQISRKDVPDSERLQQFMAYLKFEESSGDPARVQVLYERAFAEFPISSDLWLDYTRYLDKTLKVATVVRDVYTRATRNCPWVGELWARCLVSLERVHANESEISMVFEKALQCTFSSYEEYLDLFLTRVDGLRRRISSTDQLEGILDFSVIRETFQRAADYLSLHLKNTDGFLRLHSYWARLELNLAKDIAAARGVWETLVKISTPTLEAWQGYIAMEIELGHISEARSIYKRCYTRRFSGMGSEDICHSWLRFEREFGTLEDFDHAIQKVTPRLQELRLFKLQQESKGDVVSTEVKDKKGTREKRKPVSDDIEKQHPAKRQKDTATIPKKVDKPEQNTEANKVEETKAATGNLDSKTGKHKGASDPSKAEVYTDQCTAFISNLNLQANEEHLRNFFSDVGGVAAIRVLKDKFTGKSRGLAYVDFFDEEHLAAAVAKNKQSLLGKKLSIAKSDPKRSRNKDSSGRTMPGTKGGRPGDHSSRDASSDSKNTGAATVSRGSRTAPMHGDGDFQLKGKNTFAMPRAVSAPITDGDEKPKSNEEFRKMFLKSSTGE